MKANQLGNRWPFPKQELANDLDHIFRHLFNEVKQPGAWSPEWEVLESDQHYQVTLDLPGFSPEDVNIEFKDGKLTVSGQRPVVERQEGEKVHLQERRFGKFQRSLEFQDSVDQDSISAKLLNGVLTLSIPKSQKAQPRKINIQTEG